MLVTVRRPGVRMAPTSSISAWHQTSLEKERRKAEDHRGEAGWQSEHGGAPVAGTPQPSRSPASLPRARKWPNSSLDCAYVNVADIRSWLSVFRLQTTIKLF